MYNIAWYYQNNLDAAVRWMRGRDPRLDLMGCAGGAGHAKLQSPYTATVSLLNQSLHYKNGLFSWYGGPSNIQCVRPLTRQK